MKASLLFYALLGLLFLVGCSGGEEERAWNQALNAGSLDAIDSFLLQYPNSSYRRQALSRKEAASWARAELENTEYFYRKYALDYPQGEQIEHVEEKIGQIPTESLNLQHLSQAAFVGRVNYGEKQMQILSMRFRSIEEMEDGKIQFIATLNTKDFRTELQGSIQTNQGLVLFDEPSDAPQELGLQTGRFYLKKDEWTLESTDPKLYWVLREN